MLQVRKLRLEEIQYMSNIIKLVNSKNGSPEFSNSKNHTISDKPGSSNYTEYARVHSYIRNGEKYYVNKCFTMHMIVSNHKLTSLV